MKNQVCAYVVISPKIFAEIVSLSGLNQTDMILRASPELIHRLEGSLECLTHSAITAFVNNNKHPDVSGDCYLALTADNQGNDFLALDIVRPDYSEQTKQYVMDQDPIYVCKEYSGWEDSTKSFKVNHLNCRGRTFDLSAYQALSSCMEDKRDVPLRYSEISAVDPGIMEAIKHGIDHVEKKRNVTNSKRR